MITDEDYAAGMQKTEKQRYYCYTTDFREIAEE